MIDADSTAIPAADERVAAPSPDGVVVGTYAVGHGIELGLEWRERGAGGTVYLAEARYLRDGEGHGFAWRINEDQLSVHEERHHRDGLPHGIERAWDARGRLRRGFPRFWINGERVSRARYLRAWATDGGLPPFRPEDDVPARAFPPEVARQLRFAEPGVEPPIARYQFIIGAGARSTGRVQDPG